MSKLDRFLISENVLDSYPNIKVMALEKLWSDHNPILYVQKNDYGPIPFRFFLSWLQRPELDDLVKNTWFGLSQQNIDPEIPFHIKFKEMKKKIKTRNKEMKIQNFSTGLSSIEGFRRVNGLGIGIDRSWEVLLKIRGNGL
ncbi:RNA-directed DNA polymerase, eukaryota [Artemisia annua]|uniref:RNA-directed DNA polymerase, eukaryota n=1 Tax=Artemisia annua TaxID=35608 RepID=A0A2U1M8P7_ARTAN|nr:RNA-directed DNA polymerase, eukaryota [Artemisia annua]